jgi:predicted transcriptional regulator
VEQYVAKRGIVTMEKIASDIMSTELITISHSATVVQVARILARNKISGMPVVDEGKVVGVVSEADILTAAGDTTVDWVMSSDIVSVTPDTPVAEITAILKQRSIKRVLVTDRAGDLVGIVSRADIVAAMPLD